MERRPIQNAAGALAAGCFAAFVQMLTLTDFGQWQSVAMFGFALSVPFNAFAFMCRVVEHPGPRLPWLCMAYWSAVLLGQFVGVASLCAAFWHFAPIFGTVFGLASIAGYILFRSLARAAARAAASHSAPHGGDL